MHAFVDGPSLTSLPPVAPCLPILGAGKAQRIVCMCGAGISVSAGIPDFRTPGSGLYHKLEKYDLPYPQAVFEIDFFRTNPRPFFLLARVRRQGLRCWSRSLSAS